MIVRATIDLGRNLGIDVVAEGVETAERGSGSATLGCTYAQGCTCARRCPRPS